MMNDFIKYIFFIIIDVNTLYPKLIEIYLS